MREFEELKAKLSEDPQSFVAILGAGVSIPAGLPSWSGLRDILCDAIPDVIIDEDDAQRAVDTAKAATDLWHSFSRLRTSLGPFKYEKTIRGALDITEKDIPPLYKQLWKLNISGIIDFNLDKFAINAYSAVNKTAVDFASAREPHKFINFPMSYEKFVFHPHGIISDPASWVFTANERRDTYSNENFKKALSSLLNSKNLLIIGFNPEEWSFLSFLEEIGIQQRLNGVHNYCFYANCTPEACRELGEYGISTISYTPSTTNHDELNSYLDSILSFHSKDEILPTVYTGKKYVEADIPGDSECYKVSLDELRNILNGVIAGIIPADTTPTDAQIASLEKFYNTYITQLHRAWLVDPRSDNTCSVYGYKTLRYIGNGAFGSVFEAEDLDGNRCALKVLLPDVKDKMSYLSCFRRGIRSMKILRDKNIAGMVKIHDSYEIPACIVMDLVDGITLRTAINNRYISALEVKLSILEQIASIIHSAHQLEERILHRDLKPENVMLEECYSAVDFDNSDTPPKVKVLDFDLSWHRGATEKTVIAGAVSQGFMAPEQVDTSVDRSLSRNTAVDVYSIGMLAFYVLTGTNPIPNQALLQGFHSNLLSALCAVQKYNWTCLPYYLADTIISATKESQSDRCSLDAFIKNIKAAKDMYLSNTLPNTSPLILRELSTRIDPCAEVAFFDFGRKICIDTPNLSKKIVISTSSARSKIVLSVVIERYAHGADRRDGISKYFHTFKERALAVVNSDFFNSSRGESSNHDVTITLSSDLSDVVSLDFISGMAENICEIRRELDN